MNATTNFTVKSLRANKVRTLVTIAGVALAAALLTAVLTTYVSLNDYLYRSEAHLARGWLAWKPMAARRLTRRSSTLKPTRRWPARRLCAM